MAQQYSGRFQILSKREIAPEFMLKAMNGRLFKLAESYMILEQVDAVNSKVQMTGCFKLVSSIDSISEKEIKALFLAISGVKQVSLSDYASNLKSD